MKINFFVLFLVFVLFNACSKDEGEQNASSTLSFFGQSDRTSFSLKLNKDQELFIKVQDQKLEFDNKQKATLFVFFTTWCLPCNAQNPHLNNLAQKYKDSFEIIGVLLDTPQADELDDFIKSQNINYTLALGDTNFLFANSIGGINAIPTMLLYSSNGTFLKQYLGIVLEEMLDIDIQKAIN